MPALLLSLSVHEYAHAWTASRLGDDTPRRQGRLTLSPLAHIDPIGSILFPAIILYTSGGIFGWAKPVQFNPANFTRRISMRGGTALTAAAGPFSNVILALVSVLLLRLMLELNLPIGASEAGTAAMVGEFLQAMFSLNVLLAVFNLFPLPPLDGSHLLPRSLDPLKERMSRYSFVLLFAIFFIPLPGLGGSIGFFLIRPIMSLLERALVAVASIGV